MFPRGESRLLAGPCLGRGLHCLAQLLQSESCPAPELKCRCKILGLWEDRLAWCGKIVPTQTTKDLTEQRNETYQLLTESSRNETDLGLQETVLSAALQLPAPCLWFMLLLLCAGRARALECTALHVLL